LIHLGKELKKEPRFLYNLIKVVIETNMVLNKNLLPTPKIHMVGLMNEFNLLTKQVSQYLLI